MSDPKNLLLAALTAVSVAYLVFWFVHARRARRQGGVIPGPVHFAIGFVTNFFDTLGIGSFATTTSMYKLWRLVPDQQIPGTLNVGHAMNSVVQSFIYITIVQVEFQTLALMILAAVGGSWLGAAIVSGFSRRKIQIGMGLALLGAATLMLLAQLGVAPGGGQALALTGPKLLLGLAGNFMLGAFMTLGIGLYAPCLILISLLGMDPRAAFPIMMGSCAFLMPVASMQFIRKEKYALAPAVALTLGGIPAVLIAALIVRELPLDYIRWLVVIVVVYTATAMLRSAAAEAAGARKTATATVALIVALTGTVNAREQDQYQVNVEAGKPADKPAEASPDEKKPEPAPLVDFRKGAKNEGPNSLAPYDRFDENGVLPASVLHDGGTYLPTDQRVSEVFQYLEPRDQIRQGQLLGSSLPPVLTEFRLVTKEIAPGGEVRAFARVSAVNKPRPMVSLFFHHANNFRNYNASRDAIIKGMSVTFLDPRMKAAAPSVTPQKQEHERQE